MTAGRGSGVAVAGQAALEALHAENRASAVRLRACYSLYEICVEEQFTRDVEAGHYDPDGYADTPGPRSRPGYAEVDPMDIACAELVARYGVHHHRGSAILKLAIALTERFPAMISAMESGWLDERTANMLAQHMRTVDSSVLFAAQRAVLDWLLDAIIAGKRPGRDAILAQTDRIIHGLDPAGVLARRKEALRERHVRIRRRPDGMSDLTAHLPAAEASTISSVLDSAAREALSRQNADRMNTVRDGRTSSEDAQEGEGVLLGERTHGERRADALVDALLGSAADTDAAAGGESNSEGDPVSRPVIRPTITVLAPLGPDGEPEVHFPRSGPASIDTLIALLSRSVGAGITLPDPAPGAADTARGKRRYRISADLARRIRLRDGTCRHPGCSEPAENCDIDHARPFDHSDPLRGGQTTEANLMCLCRRHHRFKTFHDWRYELSLDGTLSVTTSSGHTITTSPDGPLALWRERTGPPRSEAEAKPSRNPDADADAGTATATDTDADADHGLDHGPDQGPAARPWLNPGPRSTHWHRHSRRLAAERRRNIEAMQEELAEQLRQAQHDEASESPMPAPEPDDDPPPF